MGVKSNLDIYAKNIDVAIKGAQLALGASLHPLMAELEYEVLKSWPKRGDPGHPWATNESARGFRASKIRKGIRIRNLVRHTQYVGQTKERRRTGLWYRLIPGIVGSMDPRIRDFIDGAIQAILTPESQTGFRSSTVAPSSRLRSISR